MLWITLKLLISTALPYNISCSNVKCGQGRRGDGCRDYFIFSLVYYSFSKKILKISRRLDLVDIVSYCIEEMHQVFVFVHLLLDYADVSAAASPALCYISPSRV